MSKWTRGQRNREGLTYEQNAAFWRLANVIARVYNERELR